jgi:dTDP-4-dehydrorhamnose 3,5-epimerase
LTTTALFQYKCDNFYDKESEGGLRWDDPDIGIDWWISKGAETLSRKDLMNPLLRELGKCY